MNPINPCFVDPAELKSVDIADCSNLPNSPGIYFAISQDGSIQYIGRSVNIRQRWIGHHRKKQLQKIEGIKIAYLLVEEASLLAALEQAFIDWFLPKLNEKPIEHGLSNRKTTSLNISIHPHQKERLEQVAADVNALWGDQPNISELIKMIADGRVQIYKPGTPITQTDREYFEQQIAALKSAIANLETL